MWVNLFDPFSNLDSSNLSLQDPDRCQFIKMKPPLRIAVLECDTPLTGTREKYGGYGGVFTSLLKAGADSLDSDQISSKHGLDISSWNVVNKLEYPDMETADAVLITGSRTSTCCPTSAVSLLCLMQISRHASPCLQEYSVKDCRAARVHVKSHNHARGNSLLDRSDIDQDTTHSTTTPGSSASSPSPSPSYRKTASD